MVAGVVVWVAGVVVAAGVVGVVVLVRRGCQCGRSGRGGLVPIPLKQFPT